MYEYVQRYDDDNAHAVTMHTQWQCTGYGVAPAMTTSSSSQDDTTQTYPDSLKALLFFCGTLAFLLKVN